MSHLKNVFSGAVVRSAACRLARACKLARAGKVTPIRFCSSSEAGGSCPIHPELMKLLVCPLSKEPLRYDAVTKELVCDKLGVAYPVINGVPCLVPQDGRVITDSNRDKNT